MFLSAEGILLEENFNTFKDNKYLGQSLKEFLKSKNMSHYLGRNVASPCHFCFTSKTMCRLD